MTPSDLNAVAFLVENGMSSGAANEYVTEQAKQRAEIRAALRELIDLARVRSLYPNETVRFEMVLRR